MPSPLKSISPLIPVPAGNGTPIPPPSKPDLDDLFATLFSPATPPASPLLSASSSIFTLPSNPRPPVGSINSASSTDSDFGAFVSVPASEDPLGQLSSREASPPRVPSGSRRLGASAEFFAEARAATVRNQQGLLTELLEHEDDPMYWHEHASSPQPSPSSSSPLPSSSPSPSPIPSAPASAVPSGTATPQPQQPQLTPDSAVHILTTLVKPVKTVVETTDLNPLLEAINEATSENTFARPPPPPRPESVSIPPRRSEMVPRSPRIRSPSLPPSPSRPTPPMLSRVESVSTFSPASLPSRWMTSFLTYRGPPLSTSPPTGFRPIRADITHGSPFASSPFVPASGAPGFDGDRAWNKGFDTAGDDADSPERRGVQLLGRKESTRVVLETSLANALRSHLPPRARLPRSWTLLFSIDQHGISLHTLYTRCGAHAGGALLVITTADDRFFGAWVADGIREGHGSYIGSGESFLWKVTGDGDKVRVFKWTGKNDYVALCEPESISFGGGDGHYGLYLDETLYEGSSARCPTFNNDPLCTSNPSPSKDGISDGGTATFECVGLEVWGVGLSS